MNSQPNTTHESHDESTLKSIMRKIRALMSKTTENGCTQAEAEAAAATAQRLMLAYNISESQQHAAAGETQSTFNKFEITLIVPDGSPYVKGHQMLVHLIARNSFCQVVLSYRPSVVKIVGEEANVETVRAMYEHLAAAAPAISAVEYARYRRQWESESWHTYRPQGARKWNHDFLFGFADGIDHRLQAERANAEKHGINTDATDTTDAQSSAAAIGFVMIDYRSGATVEGPRAETALSTTIATAAQVTALVVQKDKELREAVQRFFPRRTYNRRGYSTYDNVARRSGYAAAGRVDVHRNTKLA